ncbi:MAG TPA: hypothetical protein VE989_10125, partial [Sphingomicrobium sp.]|nr:hypothetical protein [Sphingomicrobium sp.]
FMLVAAFDQGGAGGTINFTTFAFGKSEEVFPQYHVVMTSGISSSTESLDGLVEFPTARGRLMIGDCLAG